MAYTHRGVPGKARRELKALARIADGSTISDELIGFSNAGTLLEIARAVLAGEIEAKRGRYELAAGHLARGVRLEDSLLYNEPPDWYYPVRHTLGAVLLEAGRPVEAEVVYWQDLAEHRNNGYALHGLHASLRAQGRDAEAAAVAERLEAAWKDADVTLESSRF